MPPVLPESLSVAQLDAILYANRKKELPDDPQISESTWRKERRTSYSREFKIRLVKQALQPGAVVARIEPPRVSWRVFYL